MSKRIANELYDIFERELGALEPKRFDFVWQYDEMKFPKIILFCGVKKRGLYLSDTGLGRVSLCPDLQKQDTANRAIQALQTKLARMSPIQRMEWFKQEEADV